MRLKRKAEEEELAKEKEKKLNKETVGKLVSLVPTMTIDNSYHDLDEDQEEEKNNFEEDEDEKKEAESFRAFLDKQKK